MSFSVYAMSGENPSPLLPSQSELLSIFSNIIRCEYGQHLSLASEYILGDLYYSLDECQKKVIGFTVADPGDDVKLWGSIYQVLSHYHFYLVWNGDFGPVLARNDTILPEGLEDELGQSIFVTSAEEIIALVLA